MKNDKRRDANTKKIRNAIKLLNDNGRLDIDNGNDLRNTRNRRGNLGAGEYHIERS